MTTDLRDKTVDELRGVLYSTDGVVMGEHFDEMDRRLSEAQHQIAEKDAALAQCVLIGRNVLLALTPDLPKGKRPTFEEFSTTLQSLPASAKHNAEIVRAAEEHFQRNFTRYPDGTVVSGCGCVVCQAVRAKKGEKG